MGKKKHRRKKMWITLIFHVNSCFIWKRNVIQLWMHREEPRSHMPFSAAALWTPPRAPSGVSCGVLLQKHRALVQVSAPLTGSLFQQKYLPLWGRKSWFPTIRLDQLPPSPPGVHLVLHPKHQLRPRLSSLVTALPSPQFTAWGRKHNFCSLQPAKLP